MNHPKEHITDNKTLFKRFCKECKKALEELYTLYPSVKELVCTNSGNKEDAKDIFQYGLIALLRYCDKDTPQTRPKALLYGICHKAWLKELERKQKEKVTYSILKEYTGESNSSNEDIEDLLTYRKSLLWKHLHQLPERGQELFDNFYRKRWSLKEIAEKMGYADENSAKTQKAKLIKKLRENMSKDPDFK